MKPTAKARPPSIATCGQHAKFYGALNVSDGASIIETSKRDGNLNIFDSWSQKMKQRGTPPERYCIKAISLRKHAKTLPLPKHPHLVLPNFREAALKCQK